MGKKEIFDKFYLTYSSPLFKYYEMYYSESMKKSRIGAIIVLVSALCFSCALGDETAATVNFWDFKNAAVKDWKDNPASFLPVDFSDTELTADLIETYGTGSRFARLSERKAETPKLLFGDPEDDYFGNQYYYKYYTAEKPLESALGTWTGSVLYVVYSVANPIVEMVSAGSGINTIYCVFMAVAERDNKATPGKIEIRVDMDCMTKIILAGYSYFYPRLEEGKEIQRVYAANLEGMYMTGFDVAFSNKDSAAGSGSTESGSTESGSTESGSTVKAVRLKAVRLKAVQPKAVRPAMTETAEIRRALMEPAVEPEQAAVLKIGCPTALISTICCQRRLIHEKSVFVDNRYSFFIVQFLR